MMTCIECLNFVSTHILENSIFFNLHIVFKNNLIIALKLLYTTMNVILVVDELLMLFYDSRRIVVGHQPLVICGEKKEQMEKQEAFNYLHHIFLNFAVVSP